MVQSRKKKNTGQKKLDGDVPREVASFSSTDVSMPRLPDNVVAFNRMFGEVADYAMGLLDLYGNIVTCSKGASRISGYAARELAKKNYRIFYTSEDKRVELPEKLLAEAASTNSSNYEGWHVRKDGTRFWGTMHLTSLHGEDGNIAGYLMITRDMTEKKLAEDNYSNFVEELKLRNEALSISEDRYHKMIAEVSDYAIILLDRDGKILDWNKGAEKLKGYTAKEIIGKSFRLFYPRDEKEARLPERLLAEAVKEGSTNHEGWRIRKDGQRFWGSVTITALHDDRGGIIGFSKVTRDLTQKKIAEDRAGNMLEALRQTNEELKRSEEWYHRMIAEVQDYAILLLNRNGEIQNWNLGATFIKGYTAEEVVGKSFKIFYPKEDREKELPEALLKYAEKYGKATHEGWRLRKDGSRFWGSIVITALHNVEGEIIGFSKVTHDLTEKKNIEDQLKANAAQLDLENKTLERLNEELSSFSHVASHDLKEPLRKIQTFVGRIEETGFDPARGREYLTKVKHSAERMQTLIEDLLSYSQVSNKRGGFERTDLNKVIAAVINDLEVAVNEKNAVINRGRLPVVSGIPYQLHQLFVNLLSNAIKFSKVDTPPRITIKAEVIRGPDIPGDPLQGNNKYHHISVEDNGIGFDHQYSDKIFDAFQRLNPRHVYAGTGIGLAIVKKIIENHHGIISAEGEPGAGATFHLYLPA